MATRMAGMANTDLGVNNHGKKVISTATKATITAAAMVFRMKAVSVLTAPTKTPINTVAQYL